MDKTFFTNKLVRNVTRTFQNNIFFSKTLFLTDQASFIKRE